MNPLDWKIHWQIFLSLLLSISLGLFLQLMHWGDLSGSQSLQAICAFGGSLFMQALKMVIVPLIVTSIIAGVMSLGQDHAFGRMSIRVVLYYMLSGFLAIVLGLVMVNLIQPGDVSPDVARAIMGQQADFAGLQEKFTDRGAGDLFDIFKRMIPANVFHAATDNGQLLGLIVFSIIFGYFISRLPKDLRDFQLKFWESSQAVMMEITQWVIRFAPLGIFCLVTPVFMKTGFEVFKPLFWFVLTVLLSLGLHMVLTLGSLLWFFGKKNPWKHMKEMIPVLLTAFSTASSASTLPVTMETVEEVGVSKRTASFTLPLGATVNMDGTALYECVVVIFIAQFYAVMQGFEIAFSTQLTVVILALLTSVGVAGIPAASLVAITLILGVVGLPLEGIGLVWISDRILDMCRTAVNVYSDTCGAVIIDRLNGKEKKVLSSDSDVSA